MKTFIFELPIEAEEYTPETCERDFGSKEAYNSDFPESVYASQNHIGTLFRDATLFCLQSSMRILAKGGGDPDKLDETQKSLYNMYENRIKYYEELLEKTKCTKIQS